MNEPTLNNNNQPPKILTPQERLNSMPPNDPTRDTQLQNIIGFIQVVSVIPAGLPKTFYDSIKIYKNGATQRLYVYATGVGWLYTALT